MPKRKHICHNAKCAIPLTGNSIMFGFGASSKDETDEVEAFLYFFTHSNGDGPFGDVNLRSKMQYDYGSQAESYFCSKQCVFDWFQRKLKDLPEPGTEK